MASIGEMIRKEITAKVLGSYDVVVVGGGLGGVAAALAASIAFGTAVRKISSDSEGISGIAQTFIVMQCDPSLIKCIPVYVFRSENVPDQQSGGGNQVFRSHTPAFRYVAKSSHIR